jgi:hypothetical protein
MFRRDYVPPWRPWIAFAIVAILATLEAA